MDNVEALYAKLALDRGFVTPQQAAECVQTASDDSTQSLTDLLVEKGYLDRAQFQQLLRARRKAMTDQDQLGQAQQVVEKLLSGRFDELPGPLQSTPSASAPPQAAPPPEAAEKGAKPSTFDQFDAAGIKSAQSKPGAKPEPQAPQPDFGGMGTLGDFDASALKGHLPAAEKQPAAEKLPAPSPPLIGATMDGAVDFAAEIQRLREQKQQKTQQAEAAPASVAPPATPQSPAAPPLPSNLGGTMGDGFDFAEELKRLKEKKAGAQPSAAPKPPPPQSPPVAQAAPKSPIPIPKAAPPPLPQDMAGTFGQGVDFQKELQKLRDLKAAQAQPAATGAPTPPAPMQSKAPAPPAATPGKTGGLDFAAEMARLKEQKEQKAQAQPAATPPPPVQPQAAAPQSAPVEIPEDAATVDVPETEPQAPTKPAAEPPVKTVIDPPAKTAIERRGKLSDLIGKTIGQCKILKKIGQGGMGAVFLAEHEHLQRKSAIKVLSHEISNNEITLKRFYREARTAASLSHPNVVNVHNVGYEQGIHFLEMEYVEGESLKERMSRQPPLDIKELVRIIKLSARGMGAAHEKGIIHRDIKPDNIMLTSEGEVKITDFGLARDEDTTQQLTRAGQLMGTPAYMSYEQCKGIEVDKRSDIYSLGASFFHLASKRKPWVGKNAMEVIRAHLTQPLDDPCAINPKLPPPIGLVIQKMMVKDRDGRYQTCQELLDDLERFERGETVAPEFPLGVDGTLQPVTARQGHTGIILLFAVISFLLLFLGSLMFLLICKKRGYVPDWVPLSEWLRSWLNV